jgi:hypothetical protein
MLQTKFGDHPSVISVGNDVQKSFYFKLYWPLKGAKQMNRSILVEKVPNMLQTKFGDHQYISAVEIDI